MSVPTLPHQAVEAAVRESLASLDKQLWDSDDREMQCNLQGLALISFILSASALRFHLLPLIT